jgi:competence protein ComEA
MMKIIQSMVLLLAMMANPAVWAESLNINTADATNMAQVISGVGEKRAQAIVDYRAENGPFKSVDGLTNVKGIGTAILEKNRENLTIGE